MEWITPKALVGLAGVVLVALSSLTGTREIDDRVAVLEGGRVEIDVELEGGLGSEHGSLHIRSHEEAEVHVRAAATGWGRWAVDVDLDRQPDGAKLVGRVNGVLLWLFGGPSAEVTVSVPHGVVIDARMTGGPVVLEDLAGPVTAEVDAADVELRRVQGPVRLALRDGRIEIEDVEGDLEVHSQNGDVEVDGVRGTLAVQADHGSVAIDAITGSVVVATGGGRLHGHVEIESVRGDVSVEGGRGPVALEDIRGDVRVVTERGRIEAEEVEGSVVVRSGRGGIELEEIEGRVDAETGSGPIDVEFLSAPEGELRTGRGEITVQVPEQTGFALSAGTARGDILVFDHDEDTRRRGRRGRSAELVRVIRGGGPTLELRTERGSIRIGD